MGLKPFWNFAEEFLAKKDKIEFANDNLKTLENKPLAAIKFPDINECKDFVEQYDGVTNYAFHGTKSYVSQYISETYPDIKWDRSKILIYTLDIEVASEHGFPDIRSASSPITSLSIHNSITDVYYVFGMGEYTPNDPDKTIKYFLWWRKICDKSADICKISSAMPASRSLFVSTIEKIFVEKTFLHGKI